jgi:hypothetical protein
MDCHSYIARYQTIPGEIDFTGKALQRVLRRFIRFGAGGNNVLFLMSSTIF